MTSGIIKIFPVIKITLCTKDVQGPDPDPAGFSNPDPTLNLEPSDSRIRLRKISIPIPILRSSKNNFDSGSRIVLKIFLDSDSYSRTQFGEKLCFHRGLIDHNPGVGISVGVYQAPSLGVGAPAQS